MKNEDTNGMLNKDPKIWAGLNKPEAQMEEADAIIFSIPFDEASSFRKGSKAAPDAIRKITYTISPTTEYFESFSHRKILDMGDVGGRTREEMFANAEKIAKKATEMGKLFLMIGGDHSVTIPVQKGVNDALEERLGIIHIDAHFDLCDSMDGDKLSHGSTERRALELSNVSSTENIFFIGIRSIEMDEMEFYYKHPINVLSARDIYTKGVNESMNIIREKMKCFQKIYVTIDIDCLDTGLAPGTGTPQFGGLSSRELLELLRGIFELPVIGFDVVEVSPELDASLTSVFAARKIIMECLGHHFRKNGLMDKYGKRHNRKVKEDWGEWHEY